VVSKSFAANDGGECSGDPAPASKGWAITDVLPEGGYTLSVGYDAAVGSIKAPHGTVKGKMLDDVVLEFKKACTIEGTEAGEPLNGTPGNDVICGYGGDDTINGRGGDDYLIGDAGHDQLSGGGGNDHILARDKTADDVNGGPGNHDVAFVDRADNVRRVEVINP
jgi:Ca2+-binding RTX toxin-like protein